MFEVSFPVVSKYFILMSDSLPKKVSYLQKPFETLLHTFQERAGLNLAWLNYIVGCDYGNNLNSKFN